VRIKWPPEQLDGTRVRMSAGCEYVRINSGRVADEPLIPAILVVQFFSRSPTQPMTTEDGLYFGGVIRRLRRSVPLLVGAVVLGAAAGAVVAAVRPIEGTATVQIGRAGDMPLEGARTVAGHVAAGRIAAPAGMRSGESIAALVTSEDPRASMVQVVARAADERRARELAYAVAQAVVASHEPIYERLIAPHLQYREQLAARVGALTKGLESAAALQSQAVLRGPDTSAVVLLTLQQQQAVLGSLARELRDLDVLLNTYTRSAVLDTPPAAGPARPAAVRGSVVRTPLIGALGGLMLAVFSIVAFSSLRAIQPDTSV
jgi:hypothetical protein